MHTVDVGACCFDWYAPERVVGGICPWGTLRLVAVSCTLLLALQVWRIAHRLECKPWPLDLFIDSAATAVRGLRTVTIPKTSKKGMPGSLHKSPALLKDMVGNDFTSWVMHVGLLSALCVWERAG